jgi:hypothetical protein
MVIVASVLAIEISGSLSVNYEGYSGGHNGHQGESWTGEGKKSRSPNGGGGGSSIEYKTGLPLGFGDMHFGGAGGSFGTKGEVPTVAVHQDTYERHYKSYVGQPGETYAPFSSIPRSLLGSGGGASSIDGSGGSGGGAIIIRVHTLINNGTICANGQDGLKGSKGEVGGGGGSGGLVLIVAEHVLGNGTIKAIGGAGSTTSKNPYVDKGGRGGDGHIIIRSPDPESILNGKMKCTPPAKIVHNLDFPDLSSLQL